MKRPWLTTSLTALILCAAGIGLYREASHALTHILTRFQETLPAGSHFTYRSASPSLLIGGATLHDVTFHSPTITFHAAKVRLGHPHFLHDGSIGMASLQLDSADYRGPSLNLHAAKAIFRHLLIPSSPKAALHTDLTTVSTHSLAAILSFNPQHLSSLRFGRTHVEGLDFTFPPQQPFFSPALHLTHITVETLTLEGYGVGSRVLTDIKNVSLSLSLSSKSTSTWPTLLSDMLCPPDVTDSAAIPLTLTLERFYARNGHHHWLQSNSSHIEEALSQAFQRDPLQNLWESPGSLWLHHLALTIGKPKNGSVFRLDHLNLTRKNDLSAALHTEGELQGIHLRPAGGRHFTMSINGQKTLLQFIENSHKDGKGWDNAFTSHLTVPSLGHVALDAHTHLPAKNPLHTAMDRESFAQNALMTNATITLKGERLLDLWPHLAHINASVEERAHFREDLIHALEQAISARPLFTPMMDYVLTPKDRSLTVGFGTLSIDDLIHLPLTGPTNAVLDRAHITSVTVH